MSLGSSRTVLATLVAIAGNRTYGSRLRLLVDYLRIAWGYALAGWRPTPERVARCAGFRVSHRHPRSLFTTFKEVFIEEDYYFEDLPERPFILDCGANIGLATLFFKRVRPSAEIVAVEPSPSSLPLLRRNLEDAHLANVHVVARALSESDGEAKFLEEYPAGVSNRLSERGDIAVETMRLSTLLDRHVDLLKIDIEGMDVIVLEELEKSRKLELVARIAVEYGLEGGGMSTLLALLERQGFRYSIDARSGRPIDAPQSVVVRAWRGDRSCRDASRRDVPSRA